MTFAFFFSLSFGHVFAQDLETHADFDMITTELATTVAQEDDGLFRTYQLMQKVVSYYLETRDQDSLAQALSFYKSIFKYDLNHFIVEMYLPILRQDKKGLILALEKSSLAIEDRKEFLRRIESARREHDEGND